MNLSFCWKKYIYIYILFYKKKKNINCGYSKTVLSSTPIAYYFFFLKKKKLKKKKKSEITLTEAQIKQRKGVSHTTSFFFLIYDL
jgi:hypothetical protein